MSKFSRRVHVRKSVGKHAVSMVAAKANSSWAAGCCGGRPSISHYLESSSARRYSYVSPIAAADRPGYLASSPVSALLDFSNLERLRALLSPETSVLLRRVASSRRVFDLVVPYRWNCSHPGVSLAKTSLVDHAAGVSNTVHNPYPSLLAAAVWATAESAPSATL
jgi:hypothetical protein